MRIRTQSSSSGHVLLLTLLTAMIIGATLASYLTLVSSQNVSVMRSMAWNSAIPVLEAGVEEALTQLAYCGTTNLSANSWAYVSSTYGGAFRKERTLGESHYEVLIVPSDPPVIYASGYAPAPRNGLAAIAAVAMGGESSTPRYIRRQVKVDTCRDAMFAKGLVAKGRITMNGNNITCDSFDSTDPSYSDSGLYPYGNLAKTKGNGDVATTSGLQNQFDVGNANIKGHAQTGPGGDLDYGPNGQVGSKAWVEAGKKGVETGYFKDDMHVQFDDVKLPSGSTATPTAGAVGGTNYTYVLGNGTYRLSSLSGTLYVGGSATLIVDGDTTLSGVRLATNAKLKLYTGSPTLTLSGNNSLNPDGKAVNMQIYGLPSCTSIKFSGNGRFTGTIYAPQADLGMKGGGNDTVDFIGASVTGTVTMTGHFNFHYDESLARTGPGRGYVVTRWNEI